MASSTSSTSGTILSGLASGIDWTALINETATIERAPETTWKNEITTLNNKNSAFGTISSDFSAVQVDLAALSDPSFFESAISSSSNPGVGSATVTGGANPGSYNFSVSRLATATTLAGAAVSAQPISSTNDVSGVAVSSTTLATPIKAGTFTVDGKTITVGASDTLQSVLDQISTATGGAVTAGYDSSTDKITLQSTTVPPAAISLGSAADTSNFLSATGLYGNNSGTVTSENRLGAVNIYTAAASSGLTTPISAGAGSMVINGVTINYDADTDTINDVMSAINASAAGVTASYDAVNHQFSLSNDATGNFGITLSDTTGNFLAATGLLNGTTTAGTNMQYSVNGSSTLTSTSNAVTGSAIGIPGLTFTAQGTGSTTVTVSPDTATIADAITKFVNDYNTAQNYIASQTATTTDSTGAKVPGLLMGNFQVEQMSSKLREMATAAVAGLGGSIHGINDIGIVSNGQDNTLALNSTTLNSALTNNLSSVQKLFTDSTNGMAKQVSHYLLNTIGGNGPLLTGESSFASQVTGLQQKITQLESKITMDEASMQNEFVLMEDAIAAASTDKQFLTAYFNNPGTASAAPSASNISNGSSSSSSG